MTEIKLTAAGLAVLAVAVMFLYLSPFAACPNCPGKRCRRCKGLGRYQRRGSRTIHRLAALIRDEIGRTRAGRSERSKP